ncbi:hypothetical protein BWI17_21980 [Betaproteobacteria bacterium GR16-43]|nr:hypothetical protein BWI17_21980 [Betaproteobacteria bacterium GR16-43]
MTWDHIAIVVIGGGLSAVLAMVAFAFLMDPRWRTSLRLAGLFCAWVLGTFVAFSYAWYNNMGIASEEYPALLQAYYRAPEKAAEMRVVLREAAPRRELFNMAISQRDRFLRAGGYCTWMRESGCRALPPGYEAQGIAIDMLSNIARGTSPYISDRG